MSEISPVPRETIKIITNEETVDTPIIEDLTLESFADYVIPKALGTLVAGSLLGSSSAYVAGGAIATKFYGFGVGGAIFGCTYFGGIRLLQDFRKEDDIFNYISMGTLHGLAIGIPVKGIRKGGLYGIAFGLLGGGYFVGSTFLYDTFRTAWINHRRSLLETSKNRSLSGARFPFEPRELPSIPNKYTPVAEDDTSFVGRARRYLQSLDKDEGKKK